MIVALVLFAKIASANPAPQKLTVILDWYINPDHAPLIIAEQQGFFKEQGLDVKFIPPANPSDPAKWVAAGKADIGIAYEPELVELVDQGLPLVRIGTLIDKPLNCVVALASSNIHSPADLKGKRIGTSNSGLSNLLIKVMLEKQGLNPKDIELVNVQYNLTQALLTHQVDAVAGLQRNVEVPELELRQQKIKVFFPEEYGIPNYSELIFITHTASIHDKRFPRFLAAIKKAVRYLDEHPKETWQQFAKQYPEANNPVNREAWFSTMPYFAEDPAGFHHDDWQHFINFMQKNKMIAHKQPISRYTITLGKEA
jgi:putative hydroxymethylpyrimidine transport system substrate-binding protein